MLRLLPRPTLVSILAASLLALACNPPPRSTSQSGTTAPQKSPGARTNPDPCLKIVNGTESQAQPAIGMIYQQNGDHLFLCTGTFVSSNTMITAAHCFPFGTDIAYVPGTSWDLTDATVVAEIGRSAIRSIKTIVSPVLLHSGDGIASTDSQKDLAVVIFPDGTAPATLPILRRAATDGEAVDLYGFGRTEIDEVHAASTPGTRTIKRHGRNQIAKKDELKSSYPNTLLLFGAASGKGSTGSLGSNGDSGGPLLIGNAVAGIASTVGLASGLGSVTSEEAFTVYSDLNSAFAQNFYREAEKAGAVFTYASATPSSQEALKNSDDKPCDN